VLIIALKTLLEKKVATTESLDNKRTRRKVKCEVRKEKSKVQNAKSEM